MNRPDRYKENNSNRDWIDEFTATSTTEETRGAFRFTIGKYLRRYGKKDDPLQEALKIQDYANRLVEFERAQRAEQDGWTPEAIKAAAFPPDFGQQHTIEPASEIDDTRPDIVASSHGDGEHYAELEKLERWKGAPEWAGVILRDGHFKIWAQANEDGALWAYIGEPVSDEPLDAESWAFVEPRP